jgi:hypothetical protein
VRKRISPKKDKLQGAMSLWRPLLRGRYYSKLQLLVNGSHSLWCESGCCHPVARIEESEHGEDAAESCGYCVKKKEACRVYKAGSRKEFNPANSGFGCAYCKYDGKPCSISDQNRDNVKRVMHDGN